MNFYKLYNLINEYGQGLIQTLIQKFQQEEPALTPTIIRSYIERFERIKNNLQEKDITKYSWKDLESTVDGYQPKQRIKAGKLDPTASDANLLYNQDGIRIYLGRSRRSCVKYGNGYSFCISARGEDNMYNHYRIRKEGTPYFIFNDNLPEENPDHVLVLFVYKNNDGTRYTITDAQNRGDKPYKNIQNIVSRYPWTKPITNFVDDDSKGTVDIDDLEMIEDLLEGELTAMKDYGFYLNIDGTQFEDDSLNELFKNSSPQEYKDFLNNKNNVALVYVFSPGYGWFDDIEDDFMLFYKTADDILKKLKERSRKYVGEDFEMDGSYEKVKEDIINALKVKFSDPKDQITRPNKFVVGENGVFGVFGKSSYRDSYFVKVSSPREIILGVLDKNKLEINKLNEYKLKYNKVFNWIENQSKEKLKEISNSLNSNKALFNGRTPLLYIDFIISFMNK